MSSESYSERDYSYSSTEEEYDIEYILDATTVNEERFITPHEELTSSDGESNVANNGSSEEDSLDEPVEPTIDETHDYSSVSVASEDENHRRSHHRINRIEMYSGEEDMFEYSDGEIRFPTRWHEGDERLPPPEPTMNATIDESSEDTIEQISSASDNDSDEYDEYDDLPSNILNYLDGITFKHNYQKAKIVTDQCKYTLDENVKCFKCHVCGDTYSAEGILNNHSHHHKGKSPECPTCKTPIEISVLSELFDKATVIEFIKTRFNEQLKTPVFEAYIDTIKLLHENGYIDPDSNKKTIIDFLKELVKIRDSRERPMPMDISKSLYECAKRIESFINELLNAFNLELTEKRMRLMDMLNELPVKYELTHEPFKPKCELRKISCEFIKSNTIIYRNPDTSKVYTYKVEDQIADIEIRETVLGQSPITEAPLKGYVHSTGELDLYCIPEIRKYLPKNSNTLSVHTDYRGVYTFNSKWVNIIQPECIIMKKAYFLIPQVISLDNAFRGSTRQRINAIQYYIEYARLLADYIEIEPHRSNLLHNADSLQKEYETWCQIYKRSINSPSDIIGMVYQMITENGSIDAAFRASTHSRTYSIFKRSGVPIQELIDATVDAMVPMATPAQRRIINEMLTKNEKENPFHRCPLRFLKSLTAMTELLCSCGGPILEHQCLLCRRNYCPHCHEPKGYYHSCDPVVLETVKILDSTTVRCPKCATRIQKSDGCDHMFCINCHCNFDWKTGKTIKESIQTNEMYKKALQGAEHKYRYYMHRFIAYFDDNKTNTLNYRSDLLFYMVCRNIGIRFTDISIYKEIDNRLSWIYNEKRYNEVYRALRPVIASTIENTMQILGATIDEYQADRLVENIIDKGIDTLKLYY